MTKRPVPPLRRSGTRRYYLTCSVRVKRHDQYEDMYTPGATPPRLLRINGTQTNTAPTENVICYVVQSPRRRGCASSTRWCGTLTMWLRAGRRNGRNTAIFALSSPSSPPSGSRWPFSRSFCCTSIAGIPLLVLLLRI